MLNDKKGQSKFVSSTGGCKNWEGEGLAWGVYTGFTHKVTFFGVTMVPSSSGCVPTLAGACRRSYSRGIDTTRRLLVGDGADAFSVAGQACFESWGPE